MAGPSNDWISAALTVTGSFEDSQDPWGGVSDNFDGMGVSLGVLQWNFGSHSLQPLATAAGRPAAIAAMPNIGPDFWSAVQAAGDGWKPYVGKWLTGTKLKSGPRAELRAYTRSQAFVGQQKIAAKATANAAFTAAEAWAQQAPMWTQVTKKLFCWFFDLWTQNGGLKGVTPQQVQDFRQGHNDAIGVVCDWLAGTAASVAGAADAVKNARSWRVAMAQRRENLFLLSYLRAQKSKQLWRVDTMNRKGALAFGSGWVHTELHNLAAITGPD